MARHIYVHIPFCRAKCPYCSFYSVPTAEASAAYWDALFREARHTKLIPDTNPDSVDSVYFGGGTPSCQPADKVCELLRTIADRFELDADRGEYTIEVNPNSITEDKAKEYIKAGFNRVSVGVQSLQDSVLKTLGRIHDSNEAKDAVRMLLDSGFRSVSADLIIGIPGQTTEDVLSDAQYLIEAGVSHISMYSLSVEEGTEFARRYPHLEDIVSEDYEREMYHSLREMLAKQGVIPYEISNCGRDGHQSIHNNSYWNGYEYYALGAGAHGYLDSVRFAHPDSIDEYISDPLAVCVEEKLSDDDKMAEFIMLTLRKTEGFTEEAFYDRFGRDIPAKYKAALRRCIDSCLVEETSSAGGHGFRLTSRGLDFANVVFGEFV